MATDPPKPKSGQRRILGGLIFGILTVVYLAWAFSEHQTERILRVLVRELNQALEAQAQTPKPALADLVRQSVTDDVRIALDRGPSISGSRAALELIPLLPTEFGVRVVELVSLETVEGKNDAEREIRGELRASQSQSADLHAFVANYRVRFRKTSSWQLYELLLSNVRQPLPEARP